MGVQMLKPERLRALRAALCVALFMETNRMRRRRLQRHVDMIDRILCG
jgi:hypothetical protein